MEMNYRKMWYKLKGMLLESEGAPYEERKIVTLSDTINIMDWMEVKEADGQTDFS